MGSTGFGVECGSEMWLETPLIRSAHLSARLKCNVYLKLENLQPSQSFKYRGVSHFVQHAIKDLGPSVHLVVASGGNAGLAAAAAANALRARCTVFLPSGASKNVLRFFETQGADVRVQGTNYDDALAAARGAVELDSNSILVPAYDHPVLWEGHASMISEISRQLPSGTKPDALFCSVGGGGLVGGVMVGCRAVGWDDVPVITVETSGSNCFYQSLALNNGPFPNAPSKPPNGVQAVHNSQHQVTLARLSKISSLASSLGASMPAPGVVKMALERAGGVRSMHTTDLLAMQACLRFAEDHKIIVELACSATLIPAYHPELFDRLVPPRVDDQPRSVVFVVCGGFVVSLETMSKYEEAVSLQLGHAEGQDVWCNGELWKVRMVE